MKESELCRKIKKHLQEKYHVQCFKHYGHPTYSEKGVPDLVGCIPPSGRMIALEIKLPGQKAKPHQYAWLQRYVEAGAICWVVHSIEDVDKLLDSIR